MSLAKGLYCPRCEKHYRLEASANRCQVCRGTLLIDYDYDSIGRDKEFPMEGFPGIWRYFRLLPVSRKKSTVSLGEGNTFLHRCDKLGRELGIRKVFVKDESTNPTGAFLDRGVAVEVSKAVEDGIRRIYCRTSGNLGAALAAYTAKAGLDCTIALSDKVDVGKLYQMIAYGANIVFLRSGEEEYVAERSTDEDTLRLTANTPYFLDGLKTTGYEICEQHNWATPDRIIVPMGSGGHISMIWRSLRELHEIKAVASTDTMLCGVQASGCAPIVKAFSDEKDDVKPLDRVETSIVDIAVKAPTEGHLALRAIRDSKGTAIDVSDREVLDAAKKLAREEGIFAEPAGASTIAGLRKLVKKGFIDEDEEIVCVITGMGLKDPKSARKFIERSRGVERFVRAMEDRGFRTKLGDTKLHILRILLRNELYGYLIWKNLSHVYHIEISTPSVYQHLVELERSGLIQRTKVQRTEGRPERQYYSITAKGKSILLQAERIERTGRRVSRKRR